MIVEPQFPRPPIGPFRRPAGCRRSCWRPATTRRSPAARDAAGVTCEAAAAAALAEAAAAVDEARRNVVALQTALTGATSELARAQESYDAVAAAVQQL